jgi:predicted helicase
LKGAERGTRPGAVEVVCARFDDMKPEPFQNGEWAAIGQCFEFKGAGIQTKRDHFAYSFSPNAMAQRIAAFLTATEGAAHSMFHDSRDRKWAGARSQPFDERKIIQVGYRPLDNRCLYNDRAYGDFLRPKLQAVWGADNCAFYALSGGTGAGPAVWCHGRIPDNHSFRGSYGGYAFPLRDNRAGHGPFNISPNLLMGLAVNYGAPVSAQDAFDAMLALLSAASYTLRFAEDLEDVLPHVPFPSDHALFLEAAALGREIRASRDRLDPNS